MKSNRLPTCDGASDCHEIDQLKDTLAYILKHSNQERSTLPLKENFQPFLLFCRWRYLAREELAKRPAWCTCSPLIDAHEPICHLHKGEQLKTQIFEYLSEPVYGIQKEFDTFIELSEFKQ